MLNSLELLKVVPLPYPCLTLPVQSEGLSDVSLSCSDGALRAHKLLLSTCSDYFLVSG